MSLGPLPPPVSEVDALQRALMHERFEAAKTAAMLQEKGRQLEKEQTGRQQRHWTAVKSSVALAADARICQRLQCQLEENAREIAAAKALLALERERLEELERTRRIDLEAFSAKGPTVLPGASMPPESGGLPVPDSNQSPAAAAAAAGTPFSHSLLELLPQPSSTEAHQSHHLPTAASLLLRMETEETHRLKKEAERMRSRLSRAANTSGGQQMQEGGGEGRERRAGCLLSGPPSKRLSLPNALDPNSLLECPECSATMTAGEAREDSDIPSSSPCCSLEELEAAERRLAVAQAALAAQEARMAEDQRAVEVLRERIRCQAAEAEAEQAKAIDAEKKLSALRREMRRMAAIAGRGAATLDPHLGVSTRLGGGGGGGGRTAAGKEEGGVTKLLPTTALGTIDEEEEEVEDEAAGVGKEEEGEEGKSVLTSPRSVPLQVRLSKLEEKLRGSREEHERKLEGLYHTSARLVTKMVMASSQMASSSPEQEVDVEAKVSLWLMDLHSGVIDSEEAARLLSSLLFPLGEVTSSSTTTEEKEGKGEGDVTLAAPLLSPSSMTSDWHHAASSVDGSASIFGGMILSDSAKLKSLVERAAQLAANRRQAGGSMQSLGEMGGGQLSGGAKPFLASVFPSSTLSASSIPSLHSGGWSSYLGSSYFSSSVGRRVGGGDPSGSGISGGSGGGEFASPVDLGSRGGGGGYASTDALTYFSA